MRLIIGLGNPGKEFSKSRHNLGFLFLDYLKKIGEFSNWQNKKGLEVKIAEGRLFSEKVILAKPQTFMNASGRAVKKIVNFYKIPVGKLLVVHDDIDIQLGAIKISKNRGAAGHKGIESIIKSLGTNDFVRIRIGIQPKSKKPRDIDKFVLKNFNKEEKKNVQEAIKKAVEAVELLTKEGLEKAMTEFNK